jgi:hypothetical protein
MPYKLRKAPNRALYWVITTETGKKHSKLPISLEKAKAQLRILKSALINGSGIFEDVCNYVGNCFKPKIRYVMPEPPGTPNIDEVANSVNMAKLEGVLSGNTNYSQEVASTYYRGEPKYDLLGNPLVAPAPNQKQVNRALGIKGGTNCCERCGLPR